MAEVIKKPSVKAFAADGFPHAGQQLIGHQNSSFSSSTLNLSSMFALDGIEPHDSWENSVRYEQPDVVYFAFLVENAQVRPLSAARQPDQLTFSC